MDEFAQIENQQQVDDAETGEKNSKTTKAKPKRKHEPKKCLVKKCTDMNKVRSRFCNSHDRCFANMCYQADHGIGGTKERREGFVKMLADDDFAAEEVGKFAEENAGVPAGKRKSGVDFAGIENRFTKRKRLSDVTRTQPFEEKQFIIKMVNEFGRKEARAQQLWDGHEKNRQWKRDNLGDQGCLRLWLPLVEFSDEADERLVDRSSVESGIKVKNPKLEDQEALRRHALDSSVSFGHSFFRDQASSSHDQLLQAFSDKPATDECLSPSSSGGVFSEEAISSPPKSKIETPTKKPPNLCKARLDAYRTADLELRTLIWAFEKEETEAQAAIKNSEDNPEDKHSEGDVFARSQYLAMVTNMLNLYRAWREEPKPAVSTQIAQATGNLALTADAQAHVGEDADEKFRSFLESIPLSEYGIMNKDQFKNCKTSKEIVKSIMAATSVQNVETLVDSWKEARRCLHEFRDSFHVAVLDMKAHVNACRRAKEKKDKVAQAEAEKEAMAGHKKAVEEQAAALQSTRKLPVPGLFTCKADGFETVPTVNDDTLKSASVDRPFLLKTSTMVQEFVADRTVMKTVGSFGASYKKQDIFKTEFKFQTVAGAKTGKTEIESFFASVFKSMDKEPASITKISAHWNTTSWLFGYDVVFTSLGFSPNSAACMKMLMLGEIEVLLVDVTTLKKAIDEVAVEGQKPDILDDWKKLEDFMKEVTSDILAKFLEKGLKIWKARVMPQTLLYVPAGWLVLEKVEKGPVIYGIRKSMFFNTQAAKESYSLAKNLLAASGSDTQRMGQVLGEVFGQ